MAYNTPNELKYTKEHEWARVEGDVCVVGITDFAQSTLGDITHLDLSEPGTEVSQHSAFGEIENIKQVEPLYSPVSGEILEMNQAVLDEPELLNSSPYDTWMVKIKMSDGTQIEGLMTADQYQEYCSTLS